MKNRLAPVLVLVLSAASASAAEISAADLKKALDGNPNLILDVLRAHKKEFLTIAIEAQQEEQGRAQREAEEAEKRDFEESFKSPKTPSVTKETRIRGKRGAKYTLVEYSDFQCPYCARGFQTVEALRQKYGEDLRFVFKNLPLTNMHPQAMPSAQYFEAITLQSHEKAWAFHDKLFANQGSLGEEFYKATAKELGVDLKRLEEDVKSQKVKDKIEADVQEAKSFGFTGTPGYLLNGIPVRGAYPVERFDAIVERLKKK